VPSLAEFHDAPCYWSEFVVRADSPFHELADTFGRRLALTVPDSQSGCLAALTHLETQYLETTPPPDVRGPLFAELIEPTITPLGALIAVAGGRADVAPLDAYALCLLRNERPELTAQVRVVGRTADTAIPPLVASRPPPARLRAAFLEAHQDARLRPLMDALMLARFTAPDPAAYDALRVQRDAAVRFWSSRRLAASSHPGFASILGAPPA
jgi:ABC-type phosphate/phosphonate transport system substrate-binding protein